MERDGNLSSEKLDEANLRTAQARAQITAQDEELAALRSDVVRLERWQRRSQTLLEVSAVPSAVPAVRIVPSGAIATAPP